MEEYSLQKSSFANRQYCLAFWTNNLYQFHLTVTGKKSKREKPTNL